jgi:hypothetical protein
LPLAQSLDILARPSITPNQWSTGSPLRQTNPSAATKRSQVPSQARTKSSGGNCGAQLVRRSICSIDFVEF